MVKVNEEEIHTVGTIGWKRQSVINKLYNVMMPICLSDVIEVIRLSEEREKINLQSYLFYMFSY